MVMVAAPIVALVPLQIKSSEAWRSIAPAEVMFVVRRDLRKRYNLVLRVQPSPDSVWKRLRIAAVTKGLGLKVV